MQIARTVAGRSFSATVPGLRCESCHLELAGGPAAIDFEATLALELALSGPVDGETFAWMRKAALGMPARELADLLGVAPETISRWENGKRAMDRSAWFILSSIVLDRAEGREVTLPRLEQLRRA